MVGEDLSLSHQSSVVGNELLPYFSHIKQAGLGINIWNGIAMGYHVDLGVKRGSI